VDVPERFREIATLSDKASAEDAQSHTHAEVAAALHALSDEDFRYLMGWMLFGRDYQPSEGNPHDALGEYVRNSVIHPRDEKESSLENKPIGQYLRAAVEHLAAEAPEHSAEAEPENL